MKNKLKNSQCNYLCGKDKSTKNQSTEVFVLITNKIKSNQLKYLLIRIILTIFEELHKILAVYFSNT